MRSEQLAAWETSHWQAILKTAESRHVAAVPDLAAQIGINIHTAVSADSALADGALDVRRRAELRLRKRQVASEELDLSQPVDLSVLRSLEEKTTLRLLPKSIYDPTVLLLA